MSRENRFNFIFSLQYGQLNDILVSKDPQLIKAITLAMKSYENVVFVKNEVVRQQLKQYVSSVSYSYFHSIVQLFVATTCFIILPVNR